MKSQLGNSIMSLIAAILHQFSLYPLFMMSNIIPFMISYLYHVQKESSPDNKSSITQDDGYFIHPIMELAMSICCFFGGIVEHYLGPRLVILIGGACIVLGDVVFIISKNLILDFFVNILFGIGFSVAMTAAVKNATKYFPTKAGLINSVAGGFGGNLGSSFFNLIIKYCVSKGDFPNNEDNNMYKKSTAENYKIFFYIHGGVVLGIAIISSLLLVPYKEDPQTTETIENTNKDPQSTENIQNSNKDPQSTENIQNSNDEQNKKNEEKNKTYKSDLKKIFTDRRIYQLLFIFLFTSFLQGFIFTVGFNYGTLDHGTSTKIGGDEMSIIFMLTSLISSGMGPLFGLIYDKIGFKYTMVIIDSISIANGILISFMVKWGVVLYGISIILNGCINGGAFSMIFPYCSKIYGFNYAGELYGFVVLSTGISSMISASVYYIISKYSSENVNNDTTYLIIFIIGAVLNLVAIIIALFQKDEPFFKNEKEDEKEEEKEKENEKKNEKENKNADEEKLKIKNTKELNSKSKEDLELKTQ